MTPSCDNCGAHLTERYLRVWSPDGKSVPGCVHCPDKVRAPDGRVRDAKSERQGTRGVSAKGQGAAE